MFKRNVHVTYGSSSFLSLASQRESVHLQMPLARGAPKVFQNSPVQWKAKNSQNVPVLAGNSSLLPLGAKMFAFETGLHPSLVGALTADPPPLGSDTWRE